MSTATVSLVKDYITVRPSYQMRHLVLAAAGLDCLMLGCPCRPKISLAKGPKVSLVKAYLR